MNAASTSEPIRTNKSQIETLLDQVQKLRDQVQPAERDSEFKAMEQELATARYDREVMKRERDEAKAELAKVKNDVAWTMEKLLIKDIFQLRGSNEVRAAEEGWLPLFNDPKDTQRIEWINKHGRVGIGAEQWTIAIPHHLTTDETLPTPYNIRHIIDLARISMEPELLKVSP